MPVKPFHRLLLDWHALHGRRDLPWQQDRTPWRVWVSEIMLQQTQVNTVIPYFQRFMKRFPDIASLAAATADEVLHLWTGLGYYSRARNLQYAARQVMERFAGIVPDDLILLQQLPGIGRSTAGAILAQAFHRQAPILDGNVRRVLTRLQAIQEWPREKTTEMRLWALAEQYTPTQQVADYTQAIMDLGATVCVRGQPRCTVCPLKRRCRAYRLGIAAQLPTPGPRKKLPLRSVTLLFIKKRTGQVLLGRRKQQGIWGGLCSLPELPANLPPDQARDYCQATFGLRVGPASLLPVFRHVFTHFQLDIQPLLLVCQQNDARMLAMPEHIWYNPKRPQAIGLPAPVKKLLESN